jgi:hypothetical protein
VSETTEPLSPRSVEPTFLQRLHNPRNSTCTCTPSCWCNRLAIGWAVKWWFPARLFGIQHEDSRFDSGTFAGFSHDDHKKWMAAQQRQAVNRMRSK